MSTDHVFFSAARALLGPGDPQERLARCLRSAWERLQGASAPAVLAALIPDARLAAAIAGVSHLGFLLPSDTRAEDLVRASRSVGLVTDGSSVPSSILAKEICELAGRPVAIAIHRARPPSTASAAAYLEMFIPTGEPALTETWIAQGIGTHVCLQLVSAAHLPDVTRAFVSAGFRSPPFMGDGSMTNPADGRTASYLDRVTGDVRQRVELTFDA